MSLLSGLSCLLTSCQTSDISWHVPVTSGGRYHTVTIVFYYFLFSVLDRSVLGGLVLLTAMTKLFKRKNLIESKPMSLRIIYETFINLSIEPKHSILCVEL